jgi:hypothetical protein
LRGFLIAVSGAQRDILRRCPTERTRFETLGLIILITSAIAGVSMWYAADILVDASPTVAVPVAIVWSLIILTVDRWIVTALPASRSRKWSVIIPRLLLAVLLGIIISTPIVLRIFQPEIDRQIVVIKQQQSDQFVTQLQNSASGRQVASLRAEVANLEAIIGANGYVPTNPATDPQIETLRGELSSAQASEQHYYQQWQCELYGGPGCPSHGSGPLAQATEQSYNQQKALASSLTSQIQERQQQLVQIDHNAQPSQLSQAKDQLLSVEQQLTAAERYLSASETNFAAVNDSSVGLLLRLQALSQLTGQSLTVSLARWLAFVLFTLIGCLPMAVKLIQQDGVYEEILDVLVDRELREVKREFRSQHPGRASVPSSAKRAPAEEQALGTLLTIDEADLPRIWGHAKPPPSWAQPEWMTEPLNDLLDSAETSTPDDGALRHPEDSRTVPDMPVGSAELLLSGDDPASG